MPNNLNLPRSWFMRPGFADCAVLLFFVWMTINNAYHWNELIKFDKYLINLGLLIVYFFIRAVWVQLKKEQKTFVGSVTVIVLLSASVWQSVLGLLQLYGKYPSNNSYFQVTGSFQNPTPLSIMLALSFCLALSVYIYPKESTEEKQYRIANVLNYLALTCMFCVLAVLPVLMIRTAWLMIMSGSLFIGVMHYRIELLNKWRKFKLLIVLLGLLIVTCGGLGIYLIKKDSADGRIFIYQVAFGKFIDQPLFGHGFNSFNANYNEWQGDWFENHPKHLSGKYADLAGSVKFAYNEYLELLVEYGLVGGLIVLVILGVIVWHFSVLRKIDNPMAIACLSVAWALAVASLFSYPFSILENKIVLAVLLAVLISEISPTKGTGMSLTTTLGLVVPGMIILLCIGVQLSYQQMALEDWKYSRRWTSTTFFNSSNEAYKKQYKYLNKNIKFLQGYAKFLSLNGKYEESNELLKRAAPYGSDSYFHITTGNNHAGLGRYDLAEQAYQRAMNITPNLLFPSYLLAKMYQGSGQDKKALRIANQILNRKIKVPSSAVNEIREEMKTLINQLTSN